jgi:G protein beta subunit-like protein
MNSRAAKTKAHRQISAAASVNCVTLHPNQAELLIGDQDGTIYRWDMAGDKHEKYVCLTYITIHLIYVLEN